MSLTDAQSRVQRNPTDAVARLTLADLLLRANRPADALPHAVAAVEIAATVPLPTPLLLNVAWQIEQARQPGIALDLYRLARAAPPDALAHAARLAVDLARWDDALALANAALPRLPAGPPRGNAHEIVGLSLLRTGQPEAALPHLVAADTDYADRGAASQFFHRLHLPHDPATHAADTAAWGRRWTATSPIPKPPPAPSGARSPMRVGYLSPDFRTHPVAAFILGPLAAHDRERVTPIALSRTRTPDATTAAIRTAAAEFHDLANLDHAALAKRLADLDLDVLVDLSGHTAMTAVAALVHRPARVVATYLGYPATTGLPAITHRITDALADPPHTDAWHTEKLVRLPRCFLAWTPTFDPPPRPMTPDRPLTFGCLNRCTKLSDEALATWARIIVAIPGSRLLLRDRDLRHPGWRDRIMARLGLDAARVTFDPATDGRPHPAAYHDIDIALDPWPYNGTTSTVEALYAGTPVLALAPPLGPHVSRVSYALLATAGLESLTAPTPDALVATAVALAADPARLAHLHATLRSTVAASPLMDAGSLARALEDAYADMLTPAAR